MTQEQIVVVRDFCVRELLKRKENKDWRVYSDGDVLPQGYGDYAVYDGTSIRCFGHSRNIRRDVEDRKDSQAEILIIIWRPDDNGSIEAWLDGPHKLNDAEGDCPRCDGSGDCPNCEGTGFGS